MVTTSDARVVQIQGKVPVCGLQCMRADVQVGYGNGPTTSGIQGKASRETKRIQHPSTVGERLDSAPVFTLIKIKSCFLSPDSVHFEPEPRLQENNRLGRHLPTKDL